MNIWFHPFHLSDQITFIAVIVNRLQWSPSTSQGSPLIHWIVAWLPLGDYCWLLRHPSPIILIGLWWRHKETLNLKAHYTQSYGLLLRLWLVLGRRRRRLPRSYNISTDIIIQLDKACRRPVRCFENAKDTARKTRPSDKSGHGSVYLRWTHQYHPQPSNLKRQDADNNAIHNYFGNAKFYAVCFLIGFTWDYRHHHRSIFVLLHNLNFKMAT